MPGSPSQVSPPENIMSILLASAPPAESFMRTSYMIVDDSGKVIVHGFTVTHSLISAGVTVYDPESTIVQSSRTIDRNEIAVSDLRAIALEPEVG